MVIDAAMLAADLRTVDRLARLALSARRRGEPFELRSPSRELRGLLGLCGLDRVLGVEPGRQAPQLEQAGRLEEEGELPDAAL
jgi:hypothetical protein